MRTESGTEDDNINHVVANILSWILNPTSIQNPSTQKFCSPHFLTVGYFYFLAGWFSRYFFLFIFIGYENS